MSGGEHTGGKIWLTEMKIKWEWKKLQDCF